MSYDLMVFEKTKAPQKRKEFLKWYEKETEWGEEHDYDDPAVSSSALQNWYEEVTKTFPNLNGPEADEILENGEGDAEDYLTDYSIGHHVIYAAFNWSLADEAYELAKTLAQKHGVGFFDVSGEEEEIFLPDGNPMG